MVSDALPEVCGIQLQHSLSKLCPSGALLVAPMACSRLRGCMSLSAMTSFTPSSHGTRWNRDVASSLALAARPPRPGPGLRPLRLVF